MQKILTFNLNFKQKIVSFYGHVMLCHTIHLSSNDKFFCDFRNDREELDFPKQNKNSNSKKNWHSNIKELFKQKKKQWNEEAKQWMVGSWCYNPTCNWKLTWNLIETKATEIS